MKPTVPVIFEERRRSAHLDRAKSRRDPATWLSDAMAADVEERLGFVRFAGKSALVSGLGAAAVANTLDSEAVLVTDHLPVDTPLLGGPWDLVVSLGELDTINDLPGALIHLRHALAAGGLLLTTILGAGSLPVLRRAMLAPTASALPRASIRKSMARGPALSFSGPASRGRLSTTIASTSAMPLSKACWRTCAIRG